MATHLEGSTDVTYHPIRPSSGLAEARRADISKCSNEDLLEQAKIALVASYAHHDEPFHPNHDIVDWIFEECQKRGRIDIMDQALDSMGV